jgi:hypothetical protein
MIVRWWNELPNKFPQIALGAFVVMPNHFHGIIIIGGIVGGDLRVSPIAEGAEETITGGTAGRNPPVSPGLTDNQEGGHAGPPQPIPPQQSNAPLSQMIQ